MAKQRLFSSRSASLQMAIEAIVVLIIAVTVLGLGLSFVKSVFKTGTTSFGDVMTRVGEEQKRTLLDSVDSLTFPTTTLDADGKEFVFAIRNNQRLKSTFSIQPAFSCFDALGDDALRARVKTGEVIQFESFTDYELAPTQSAIIPVRFNVLGTAPATLYKCRVAVNVTKENGIALTNQKEYAVMELDIKKK